MLKLESVVLALTSSLSLLTHTFNMHCLGPTGQVEAQDKPPNLLSSEGTLPQRKVHLQRSASSASHPPHLRLCSELHQGGTMWGYLGVSVGGWQALGVASVGCRRVAYAFTTPGSVSTYVLPSVITWRAYCGEVPAGHWRLGCRGFYERRVAQIPEYVRKCVRVMSEGGECGCMSE